MSNPYLNRPDASFWKTAVALKEWTEVMPISKPLSLIKRDMKISAAGSCFAQKVANYIKSNEAIEFLELESVSPGQPIFSARYGNIYTTRQLLELIQEALSGDVDESCAVQREDGQFVDVFRPFVEEAGFDTSTAVIKARQDHLLNVIKMFEESDVFVFTLGLTESWFSKDTGRTFPVCPGIFTNEVEFEFVNYGFNDVINDMRKCVELITAINTKINIIVTVSPVPLTATYTDDHVMSATSYSKSVLRAVCGEITRSFNHVKYFPSFEIVVNPFRDGTAFEDNKRSVNAEIVDIVMRTFENGFLEKDIHTQSLKKNVTFDIHSIIKSDNSQEEIENEPVCDDVNIEKSVGF